MLIGGHFIPDILGMVVDERVERVVRLAEPLGLVEVEPGPWATAFLMSDKELNMEFWFTWHIGVCKPGAAALS